MLNKKFRWIYISEIIQEDLSFTIVHGTVINARKTCLLDEVTIYTNIQVVSLYNVHFHKVLHRNEFKTLHVTK